MVALNTVKPYCITLACCPLEAPLIGTYKRTFSLVSSLEHQRGL